MLTHIHIRDFAIIDRLEVELDAGMTALTGETGAGKSILVDALGLALGDRADSSGVRTGAQRAEISVGFDLADHADARQWLEQHDLGDDGDCQLRRVITQEGRSRGYINGRPVPMQLLKELGELLVDIHGQHEHQSLLRRDIQRRLLDDYAGNEALTTRLAEVFDDWKARTAELAALREAAAHRAERSELLRFQVQELETLGLAPGEAEALNEEHRRLANAGQLLDTCQTAVAELYERDEGSVHDRLSRISSAVDAIADMDPALAPVTERLTDAMVQVDEAVDALRRYTDRLDLEPGRLAAVEERLGTVHDLSRKHHVNTDELPQLLERLTAELASLEHADERLTALQDDIDRLRADYDSCAQELGRTRRAAARKLNTQVTAVLQDLGMAGAKFEIAVQAMDPPRPTPAGLETVEFTVRTNPGQPFGALAKIASGGELSRVSLAIQVVSAASTRIPTLIYDEVDTGIGGGVAEVVGRRLRTLGGLRQVLCVTHLPQVAAQAHHHLQVGKATVKGGTRTSMQRLQQQERIEEIARMLGGIKITPQTLAHAREMLEQVSNSDSTCGNKKNKARA